MYLPLLPRQDSNNNDNNTTSSSSYAIYIVSTYLLSLTPNCCLRGIMLIHTSAQALGVVLSVLILLYVLYLYLRMVRARNQDPKYVPTSFLKSRWRAWNPANYGRIAKPAPSHTRDNSLSGTPLNTTTIAPNSTGNSAAPSSTVSTSTRTNNTNIDHRLSVRSIISLPPYNPEARPTEQVIAREGERGGIDTVVEFPETEGELEEQREAEMQTLYAIRQARRQQQAERDERRAAIREARERHDYRRLEELEREQRQRNREEREARNNATGLAATQDVGLLIAELQSQREARKDRRVPEVSYGHLGLARHDGSRIRADSVESDARPLLSSAASMASSPGNSRAPSPSGLSRTASSRSRVRGHYRGASQTSIASTVAHETDQLTPQTSPEQGHGGEDDQQDIPAHEPPSYENHCAANGGCPEGAHRHADGSMHGVPSEEAPPYSSPVAGRGEGPSLPAIVIGGATPGHSVPGTPVREMV